MSEPEAPKGDEPDGPRLGFGAEPPAGGGGRPDPPAEPDRSQLRRADVLYEAAAAERAPVVPRRPIARPGDAVGEPPENPLAVLTELVPPSLTAPTGAPGGDAGGPERAAPRVRARTAPPPATPFWRYGFPLVMVALVALIPVLVLAGRTIVLQSTEGQVVSEVTDPAAPGWQAITDPTPTMLLVQTDEQGALTGLTAMSLTGEGAGGLVFLPLDTAANRPDGSPGKLRTIAEREGLEAVQQSVEAILGAGMAETTVVGPQQLADLVAPVAPITVENPDAVTVADGRGQRRVLFPKGEIELQAADVAPYLATTSPGESDLNRLLRNERFWQAWLREIGASDDPQVIPGETSSGLGRFVRTLADSRVEMFPLPVQSAGIPGSDETFFMAVPDQVAAVVARLVPFPIGAPPGVRPRVRLLDGTGTLDHGLPAAPLVVQGGGQIDQIGNAATFGAATTTLTYYDDARRADVEALQRALGLGEIVKSTDARGAVDVVIVLGQDFAAAPPKALAPVTAAPATATTTAPSRSTTRRNVEVRRG